MGRYLKIPRGRDCLRIIALPDLHLPYNIDISCVESFMADFQPTHLIYLGDTLNFDCVSHWIEERLAEREGLRLKDDYDSANDLIARHRAIVGRNCKVIYFLGNHEEWINQTVSKFPQFKGMLEVENWLKGVDVFVPFNKLWTIGHLSYLHGMWCNKYHAAKHVDSLMCNLIYGHTHDVQEFTKVTPQDMKPIKAKSVGCLCKFDMPYMKKRPSSWVNAFSIAYIRQDGTYNEYTINIVDGKFSFCGKNYGGQK